LQTESNSKYLTLALSVRKLTDSLIALVEDGTQSEQLEKSLRGGRVAHPANLLIGINLHERVAHPAFFWRGGAFRLFNDETQGAPHPVHKPPYQPSQTGE